MKILVIGAHGQIGRQLVQILQTKENCQVIAGLRSASQQEEYQQQNIMTAYVDLTKAQAQLEQVMQGVDVVVFAAGSGGKTGADATMMIDLDGAVKAINAAEKTNVSRFIMISSIKANDRGFWSDNVPPRAPESYYYAAKYYADEWLLHSSLDYTILRPARLINQPATGKIQIASQLTQSIDDISITRADVAETVATIIESSRLHKQQFDLANGNTPIAQAVEQFN